MQVTVREVAALVQGRVEGDETLLLEAAKPVNMAGPGEVSFLESDRLARLLKTCRAGAVIVPESLNLDPAQAGPTPFTFIRVKDPLGAFIALTQFFQGRVDPPPHGIDPRADVHPSVQVGADPSIFPFASVGEGTVIGDRCRLHAGVVVGRRCRLGHDVVLHPNVVLYDETVLGDRVVVHANAVLGADGFGYRFQEGRHVKVPQFGSVEVGDDVEIGAGTTIDRGTFQPTRIGAGTKIDNLVQVGHNCQLGRHNVLVSQVGMAGSCSTGDYVVLAGQVGVADHVHIGDRAQVGAKSGIFRDVPEGERVLGAPGKPEGEQKRILLSLERLPELRKDVRHIKQRLGMADE